MKQKAFGDTLVEAPSGGDLAAEVIAAAKQRPAYSSFYVDLDSLGDRLRTGEALRLLALGMSGLTPVLVGLTNQRVLLHANNPTAKVREGMDLPVNASWKSTPLSSVLTFRSGPHEMEVGTISDAVADKFLDAPS